MGVPGAAFLLGLWLCCPWKAQQGWLGVVTLSLGIPGHDLSRVLSLCSGPRKDWVSHHTDSCPCAESSAAPAKLEQEKASQPWGFFGRAADGTGQGQPRWSREQGHSSHMGMGRGGPFAEGSQL